MTGEGLTAAVDRVLAELPMSDDGTGHIVDCGWDDSEMGGCDCVSLRARLAQALDPILNARTAEAEVRGREAALREAADLVESLRVHVDTDPASDCPDGCGWFNYAAAKVRARADLAAEVGGDGGGDRG